MNVVYTEKASRLPQEHPLLPMALDLLQTTVGRSGEQVTAEWDRDTDAKGRSQYVLTLRDASGEAHTRFAPEGLEMPDYLLASMDHLWSELLQKRSDGRHDKLLQLLAQLEGDDECPDEPTTNLSGISPGT